MSGSQEISKQQVPVTPMSAANIQSPAAARLPAVPVFQQVKEEEKKSEGLPADDSKQFSTVGDNTPDVNDGNKDPVKNGFAPPVLQRAKNEINKSVPEGKAFLAFAGDQKLAQPGKHETLQRFSPSSESKSNIARSADSGLDQAAPIQRKATIKLISEGKPKVVEVDDLYMRSMRQKEGLETMLLEWAADRKERIFDSEVDLLAAAHSEYNSKSLGDNSLQKLAKTLNDPAVAFPFLSDLSDERLLAIHKNAFEGNWFKAKACLTMGEWPWTATSSNPHPDHAKCLLFMQLLVNMRGREWAKFKVKSTTEINAELEITNEKEKVYVLDAKGSDSLTSDMDLAVKGRESEKAIKLYNSKFKTHFKVPYEPGTVFDINLYALDWMHGTAEAMTIIPAVETPEGLPGKPTRSALVTPKLEPNLTNTEIVGNKKRDKTQEIWSYVKIMRNLKTPEIADYKLKILAPLKPTTTPEYKQTSERLEDAQIKTTKFHAQVAARVRKMSAEFATQDLKFAKLNSAFKSTIVAHSNNRHYQKEALAMQASNSIYEEKVAVVKSLRVRIYKMQVLEQEDENKASLSHLATLLANKIAEALTFANEVYSTEGGVLHTVLGKQEGDIRKAQYAVSEDKKDVVSVTTALKSEQYMHSINENVGDSIHSLNHYAHNPQYGAFRAGKYIERMVEAVELLYTQEAVKLKNKAPSSFGEYNDLQALGATAAAQKKGEIGKDPAKAKEIEPFSTYDPAGIAELKTKIIKFGAETSGYYRKYCH